MSHNPLCGTCYHFTLRDAAGEPLPQAASGIGACHGYDGHAVTVEPFVRWDARPCIAYGKAADMAKRLQFCEMRKRKEGADVAPA
ncbi:MAG: hypothetical protein JWQ01_4856 [Massilia sp.]|nr:hypothetical protein [Massilia sp.]